MKCICMLVGSYCNIETNECTSPLDQKDIVTPAEITVDYLSESDDNSVIIDFVKSVDESLLSKFYFLL